MARPPLGSLTLRLRRPLVALGLPMMVLGWAVIWSQDTPWNPIFFAVMWLGATLTMYSVGEAEHPGWRVHAALAATSLLVWWWFELVNSRVANWQYIYSYDYSDLEYFLLASVAFSTVVPALHSAWRMVSMWVRPRWTRPGLPRRWYVLETLGGLGAQILLFGVPEIMFPLTWVAPFLVLDGVVGYMGGRNLAQELLAGEWRLAAAIGLAGILCGFLWEFWNFWAAPKWVYDIPYLDLARLFEMPMPGYLGYIPFAWSVHQLLEILVTRRLPGVMGGAA